MRQEEPDVMHRTIHAFKFAPYAPIAHSTSASSLAIVVSTHDSTPRVDVR